MTDNTDAVISNGSSPQSDVWASPQADKRKGKTVQAKRKFRQKARCSTKIRENNGTKTKIEQNRTERRELRMTDNQEAATSAGSAAQSAV